jgi:hypothetical protein
VIAEDQAAGMLRKWSIAARAAGTRLIQIE